MAKKNEIAKVDTTTIQPVEQIESLILTIRGKQVILDRDLARLYGVETGRLNEQVKRNIERFPEDFMFQLTKEEFEDWKSQFAISNGDSSRSQFATLDDEEKWKSQIAISNSIKMGARKLPYAFTEKRRSHVEQCSPHTISHQHQHPDHARLHGITAFLGIECPNVPTAGGYRT